MGDNFNNILSDKFKNHKPEVPPHLWSAIEQNVGKKKEDNKGLILFFWGLFTSTALCGMYFLNDYIQTKQTTYAHGVKALYPTMFSTLGVSQNLNSVNTEEGPFNPLLRNDEQQLPSHYKQIHLAQKIAFVGTGQEGLNPETSLSLSPKGRALKPKSKGGSNTDHTNTLNKKSGSQNINNNNLYVNTVNHDRSQKGRLHNTSITTSDEIQMVSSASTLMASLKDTLTVDTLQEEICLETVAEPQKTVKDNKKQQNVTQEVTLSFSPFKVSNISKGIDQGYEVTANYGRALGQLKLNLGLSYAALGTPLHYQVPANHQIQLATDPRLGMNPDNFPSIHEVRNSVVLMSLHTLGLNIGIGYQKKMHEKWRLETGISMQPTLILKSSHINTSENSDQQHYNTIGQNNFRTFGMNIKANVCMAYRPIYRAELIFGIQSGYTPLSIHKTEKIKPFSLGPLLGLKWLF